MESRIFAWAVGDADSWCYSAVSVAYNCAILGIIFGLCPRWVARGVVLYYRALCEEFEGILKLEVEQWVLTHGFGLVDRLVLSCFNTAGFCRAHGFLNTKAVCTILGGAISRCFYYQNMVFVLTHVRLSVGWFIGEESGLILVLTFFFVFYKWSIFIILSRLGYALLGLIKWVF